MSCTRASAGWKEPWRKMCDTERYGKNINLVYVEIHLNITTELDTFLFLMCLKERVQTRGTMLSKNTMTCNHRIASMSSKTCCRWMEECYAVMLTWFMECHMTVCVLVYWNLGKDTVYHTKSITLIRFNIQQLGWTTTYCTPPFLDFTMFCDDNPTSFPDRSRNFQSSIPLSQRWAACISVRYQKTLVQFTIT